MSAISIHTGLRRIAPFCAKNSQTIENDREPIWIADAHRGEGKRFIVQADQN